MEDEFTTELLHSSKTSRRREERVNNGGGVGETMAYISTVSESERV